MALPPVRVGLMYKAIFRRKMKWDPVYRSEVMGRYQNLTLKAAVFKPDLIVWPEAVTPFFLGRDALQEPNIVLDTVRQAQTPLVLGSLGR